MSEDQSPDALERLSRLAIRDPIASIALAMHRSGRPLVDCLVTAAESWSGMIIEAQEQQLKRLIERPPEVIVMPEAEIERIENNYRDRYRPS